jgi:hypothetical protein
VLHHRGSTLGRVERRDQHAHDNSSEVTDLHCCSRKKHGQYDGADLVIVHDSGDGSGEKRQSNRSVSVQVRMPLSSESDAFACQLAR